MTGLVVIGIVASLLTSKAPAQRIEDTTTYARTMAVVEIDEAEDMVTIADFNGYEWQFIGVEDWLEGDICTVIMDNNGTSTIEDDVIMSTYYSGWIDCWGYDYYNNCALYNFNMD